MKSPFKVKIEDASTSVKKVSFEGFVPQDVDTSSLSDIPEPDDRIHEASQDVRLSPVMGMYINSLHGLSFASITQVALFCSFYHSFL